MALYIVLGFVVFLLLVLIGTVAHEIITNPGGNNTSR